jgi:DNA helicase-4
MPITWRPSIWGQRFTGNGNWELTLDADGVRASLPDATLHAAIGALEQPTLRRGLFWSTVDLQAGDRTVTLKGLPHRSAKELEHALNESRRAAGLREHFDETATHLVQWVDAFTAAAQARRTERGWLTREFSRQWEAAKPGPELAELLGEPLLLDHIGIQNKAVLEAIEFWKTDLNSYARTRNEQHFRAELHTCRDFFDRIERSPLTEEQARAVVCFDNRVQVIASAGSGKTSTMVAKAAYAVYRGLVPAEKILLLAFNKDAADELKQRLRTRLRPFGLNGDDIAAKTFHSFGLEVIGQATGRKPALAPWLESGQDHEQLKRIVDKLKVTDPAFRLRWEFFRLVLSRDLPRFGQEEDDPEDWDPRNKRNGFRTLQGEVVKSQAERMIADWLFYNGIRYAYEPRYKHDTTDATHRQYSPDFYYPDIDAYHEHFALDEDGRPPAEFEGYLEGVHWKRALHQRHGTTLLETTMAGIWDGTAFTYLEKELTARGLTLSPDPGRPVAGRPPIENEQLVRTFRTFLIHAKSNRLDDGELRSRLRSEPGRFRFRHGIFLSLFAAIREQWDRSLAAENCIDFEDMLNLAADHLESGAWDSTYELVMVDEMQDASHARARLARALVNRPRRHLFAVGDDWQSINRFAGADLSVMTDFDRWFGEGETLRLERTFRSPQSICDISSSFIRKNPDQLAKSVVSATPEFPPAISAVSVANTEGFTGAIGSHLDDLNRQVHTGAIPPDASGKLRVLVLGRYRNQVQHVPSGYRSGKTAGHRWEHLDVRFKTIHGSKGLEADYVIIPGLTKGSYGFPSTIIDDPVLRLAMPEGDDFPLAEERRLFYVALTRAKRAVLLLTVQHKESPFLLELVRDHGLTLHNEQGTTVDSTICPRCKAGFMVQRSGEYGAFFGCSNYPRCRHTMKLLR